MVHKSLLGVNQACKLFGISKYAYYNSKNPIDKLQEKYGYLKKIISKIIEKNPSYGYRRMKIILDTQYGYNINHKVIKKLLKLWGLSLKRKIRKTKKNYIKTILDFLKIRANILRKMIQDNKIKKPMQVILSDVTEIYYNNKKAYLCVHMDYFSKIIYGWSLSLHNDTSLVLKSIRSAIKKIKKYFKVKTKKIVCHQDRGSVNTSEAYVSEILKNKMYVSYSRKGEPGDNAVNESFFSRFKEENRDLFFDTKDYKQLYRLIKSKIKYYNSVRLHSSLGYKTPLDFTRYFLAASLS
jgi:putative transposase